MLVQIGSYRADNSKPTTEALTPLRADCKSGRCLKMSQKGSGPMARKKAGKKMAPRVINAPTTPLGGRVITVPRNALNVNKGPGTA